MSKSQPHHSSPSNSQIESHTKDYQEPSTISTTQSAETPQFATGQHSQSTPHSFERITPATSDLRSTDLTDFVNESRAHSSTREESVPRRSRPLSSRHASRTSSSQPPRRVFNPYSRTSSLSRLHSQSRSDIIAVMSSASTPSNTSTAGSNSGSNPSYQLPYAPFPYPMPSNGGQGGKGGSGK